MGKTIVRKDLDNMNAQRVWEEFAAHMTTSSKGKAEKRRLHTYVTTTVLDKSWKGTTEQFILHFNEQFRQLDEVSPPEESLPYTTRLTLLQTAVHNIPELRMVETKEEFISLSSSTPGPTMGYDNYLTLLQNACIRYDRTHTSKPSPASRAAYQHELSPDQHDNPYPQDYSSSGTTYGGIDMPAEEFYQVHTTNLDRPPSVSTITPRKPISSPPTGRPNPRRSPGPIFLPANIYKLLVMWPSRSSKSTMPLPDPPLHPKGLSIPVTQTLTPSLHPLTLPQVIQPLQSLTEFRQPLQVQSHLEMPGILVQLACINTSIHNGFVTKEFVKIDEDSQTQDYTIIYIKFQGQTPPFSTHNQDIFERVLPTPFPQVGDILSEEEDN